MLKRTRGVLMIPSTNRRFDHYWSSTLRSSSPLKNPTRCFAHPDWPTELRGAVCQVKYACVVFLKEETSSQRTNTNTDHGSMRYVCPKCGEAFAVKPPSGTCRICDATL